MTLEQVIVSALLKRLLAQLPSWVFKRLPQWGASAAKGYVRWLWRLDPAMKLVMLMINVALFEALVHGVLSVFGALAQLGVIALVLFFAVSLVFGRGTG